MRCGAGPACLVGAPVDPDEDGPLAHLLTGYGMHEKFHRPCCPRLLDGVACEFDHEAT